MDDLNLFSEMIITSSNLSRSAKSLKLIASGETLTDRDEIANLNWTGEFLSAMDWDVQKKNTSIHASGNLAIHATSIRPTFYACLFRIGNHIQESGINDDAALSEFLHNLYDLLLYNGTKYHGKIMLKVNEINLGALLLDEIANSILIQINNNGLSRQDSTSLEIRYPITHEFAA